MRRPVALAAAFVTASMTLTVWAVPAGAAPPTPPGEAAARRHLAAVRTASEGTLAGYSRARFPHWATVSGACNTRETVLKRDGRGVHVNSRCSPTSGHWFSPYDGKTWSLASDIDIDHMVPLAEAWRSGARSWTTARRRQLANDLRSSQLWAVTDNVNQAKGDRDPAEWKPSRRAVRCLYARSWIDVKWRYGLAADRVEKTALRTMLNRC